MELLGSILVGDILGGTRVNYLDCVCMCVMEEGSAKACCVKEGVGGVVDFSHLASQMLFILDVREQQLRVLGKF